MSLGSHKNSFTSTRGTKVLQLIYFSSIILSVSRMRDDINAFFLQDGGVGTAHQHGGHLGINTEWSPTCFLYFSASVFIFQQFFNFHHVPCGICTSPRLKKQIPTFETRQPHGTVSAQIPLPFLTDNKFTKQWSICPASRKLQWPANRLLLNNKEGLYHLPFTY